MSKFLVFYGSLLFTFIHFNTADVPYKCIHDRFEISQVPAGSMAYKDMRGKRDRHGSSFIEPLTIHTHIDEVDPSVSKNVVYNIDFAMRKVERHIAETLQVSRTFNPFVLERSSCRKVWKSGPNKGRCAQFSSNALNPKSATEFCYLNLTNYVIPPRYLNSLETFDYDEEMPTDKLPKGQGVEGANFILFLISKSTPLCLESGVQAYGSYCRLDSHNRPVAGLINMCPEFFSKRLYKPTHYFNVLLHEVLHILGFSSRLYSKYKVCSSEHECQLPKRISSTDRHGIQRLVFPKVVENMQAHFGCNDVDFGGPLEENTSNTTQLTSHWHPLLMFSSIMTPSILEGDYVVLDNITLGLLASTGWYTVDFVMAEAFVFGKGGGCNFSYTSTCETSKSLCTPSEKSSKGCDILHFTIGKCASIVPSHPCGVYRSNYDEMCADEQSKYFGVNLRSFFHERRCVMVEDMTNRRQPSCLVVKCRKLTGIEVYINSTWISCPLSKSVTVNNVNIECPTDPLICPSRNDSGRQFCSREENFALSVRIYFTEPAFHELFRTSNYRNFKASAIEAIARTLKIPVNYIVNSTMFFFKIMYLDFAICPPKNISERELRDIIKNTQNFLKSSSFSFIFSGIRDLPAASTKYMVDPDVALAFSDYEGFRMLTIVPVICAIFVLATFIASVSRYIIIQTHRPKRETIEMENLEQTPNENKSRKSSSISPG